MLEHRIKAAAGALIIFCVFFAIPAKADLSTQYAQFHLRIGAIDCGFGGTFGGNVNSTNSIELEYEIFNTSRTSTPIRGLLVDDFSGGRVVYAYTGVGKRYYILNGGIRYDYANANSSDQLSSLPKWRAYVGGDLGISQLVVRVQSPTTLSATSLLEIGPSGGAIFQYDKNFGFEVAVGLSAGLGFSGVSTTAMIGRFFVGGSYYF